MVDYINGDSIYDIGYDIVYNRDATKDVSINSINYYTRSATPVVGMPLYDSTGVATGDTIYQVNQDGTWDLYVEPTVEIILNDTTTTLTAGTYKYICIGGGASGQNAINSSQSVTTTQTRKSGGAGGMGGGSGYITYGDFTLDEDTEISFTVGKGGVQTNVLGSGAPIAGGASTITKVSDSSVLGTADGGKLDYSRTILKSSSGGSGGAAQSGRYANYALNNYSSRGPSNGHNGGIGGGNGQPHAYQTDEDAAVWANESGKGYYNAVKSYANNAGVKGSPGTSGGGGIGVSAIQDIITVDFINNMDDTKLQTLYNSIGGGGSGGAATVYDTDTIAGSGGAGGVVVDGLLVKMEQ